MRHFLTAFCILLAQYTNAQSIAPDPTYPQDYFRNPLGIPIMLAGNFGECRPGHFHSGMDIKTQGRENLPVYAAADGYVSRMRTSKGGFGHALYIDHPNGYTTLYAHLNDFAPALQQYLRQQQYEQENWETDITLSPGQFPVKKGEQIAWSGNTGGSAGPHLHFEIRNTATEHPLNPQLFGFNITDNRPPVPLRLAVYESPSENIYRITPRLLPLKKTGDNYIPATGDTIAVHPAAETGIGIEVNDFMDGSNNTLGFYIAELYQGDVLQSRIRLDDIGYQETRYLHAYTDYKTRHEKRNWIQCFFRLPGNQLHKIYDTLNTLQGQLKAPTNGAQEVRIVIKDVYNNQSHVRFFLRADSSRSRATTGNCTTSFRVSEMNQFETNNLSLALDPDALYTDICFELDKKADANSYSDRFQVHHAATPVHSYFDLKIKPSRPIPFNLQDKIALLYHDGKKETGTAAEKDQNGWYKKSVRSFGAYRLALDTIPPRIISLNGNSNNLSAAGEIRLRATDNMTGIKSFRATLNGKWLLFQQRGNDFFYKFDEHCPKGKHTLKVTTTDENGNTAVLSYPFVR